MTDRQTVAGAYQKIEAHEDLCAERYRNIHDRLGELNDGAKAQHKLQWGVLVAIAAFLAVQVFQDLKDGPPPAPVHATAVPSSS